MCTYGKSVLFFSCLATPELCFPAQATGCCCPLCTRDNMPHSTWGEQASLLEAARALLVQQMPVCGTGIESLQHAWEFCSSPTQRPTFFWNLTEMQGLNHELANCNINSNGKSSWCISAFKKIKWCNYLQTLSLTRMWHAKESGKYVLDIQFSKINVCQRNLKGRWSADHP